jgi:RNA polymerase sigma-70 factor (ECF subfamily)
MDARATAEAAARASYGRLVAILAARSRDIAGAEDALADAFLAALRVWPERGVPANPEGWLLTVARNADRNRHRHRVVQDGAAEDIARLLDEAREPADFPDERLKLLFVCAHPAIDEAVRTPLMLQTVLGLDAARIAAAFLVSPAAMGQRLVRAKSKIRDAGLRFEVPDPSQWPERLEDVLDAIYAAYGSGWESEGTGPEALSREAIFLGRLVVSLLPEEPEARGLLSLMLHSEARRPARLDAQGRFVPLDRQDPRLWSRDLIAEAENHLTRAAQAGQFGRYQCEAAIQSVHAQRGITGQTNNDALRALYGVLMRYAPSLGAAVGQASLALQAGDASGALAILDGLPGDRTGTYQPFWVTRFHALRALDRLEEAAAAHARALDLTTDEAVRRFLVETGPQAGL